jgi:hypothetical protein
MCYFREMQGVDISYVKDWVDLSHPNLSSPEQNQLYIGTDNGGRSSSQPRVFAWGAGEAANFPAAVKTVANWFPKRERALATGIFNSGSSGGAIAAPLLVPLVTAHFGWAFLITGAIGFAWLALIQLLRRASQMPVLVQAFRFLGMGGSVKRNVALKQRQRALSEDGYVESFVILNAAGGDCLEDAERLCRTKARKFLYQFLEESRVAEAQQQRLAMGQRSYIPTESAALQGRWKP